MARWIAKAVCLFGILALLTVCTGSVGWAQTLAKMGVMTVGGGVPAAAPSFCAGGLCGEQFDTDVDGTELSSLATNPWTEEGDSTNLYVIDRDVTQRSGSTGAAMFTIPENGDGNSRLYRSFTKQTSGTVLVTFHFRYDNTGATDNSPFDFVDGEYNDEGMDGRDTILLYCKIEYDKDLKCNGTDTTANLDPDTWYKLEFTVDLDNDQYDLDIDDVNVVTDGALANAGLNFDRFYLRNKSVGAANTMWIDDLCIE